MNIDGRDHYLADFARIAGTLPGTRVPWLTRLRTDALDAFAQKGFPTRRDEEWKYTSVAALEKQLFSPTAGATPASIPATAVQDLAFGGNDVHLLVFVDGRFVPALSAPGRLPSGVQLGSLAEVLDRTPELMEAYLSGEQQSSAFAALNTAFMSDGAFLYLRRGAVLEAPVHLLFISSVPGIASHVRNVIVAEDGTQATVIEHYAGAGDASYFTNAVTQVHAGQGASIEHHKLQQEAQGAFHVAGIHAVQMRDSRLASHSFSLGAALARNDITTVFEAVGCEATLNGLYLAGGRQHVDHHTRIDHRKPNGTSRENYRGVLDGAAHGVFNGKVIVHPDAQKTNAFQANHNLLLSRDAEIDTKPQLEIFADDVKCNHGATVGRLDANQLFYLRSRGIDEATARNMLVRAFAHDVIERIRVAALRTRLETILLDRLPPAARMEEMQ